MNWPAATRNREHLLSTLVAQQANPKACCTRTGVLGCVCVFVCVRACACACVRALADSCRVKCVPEPAVKTSSQSTLHGKMHTINNRT